MELRITRGRHKRITKLEIIAHSAEDEVFLSDMQLAMVGDVPSQVEVKRCLANGDIRKIRWVSDAGIPEGTE